MRVAPDPTACPRCPRRLPSASRAGRPRPRRGWRGAFPRHRASGWHGRGGSTSMADGRAVAQRHEPSAAPLTLSAAVRSSMVHPWRCRRASVVVDAPEVPPGYRPAKPTRDVRP
jgi:hypothetical protein